MLDNEFSKSIQRDCFYDNITFLDLSEKVVDFISNTIYELDLPNASDSLVLSCRDGEKLYLLFATASYLIENPQNYFIVL